MTNPHSEAPPPAGTATAPDMAAAVTLAGRVRDWRATHKSTVWTCQDIGNLARAFQALQRRIDAHYAVRDRLQEQREDADHRAEVAERRAGELRAMLEELAEAGQDVCQANNQDWRNRAISKLREVGQRIHPQYAKPGDQP